MASGDNHQQWAFPQFQQQGQDAVQTGNFGDQGYGDGANDAFTIAQQWQAQDNHFSIEPEFSSYQAQDGYPVQQQRPPQQQPQVQHFPPASAHAQSHQHPQTFAAPLALDGAQNMSWEGYDFGFGTDSTIRGGAGVLGPENPSYSGGVQQGHNANGLSSTSSFPQSVHLTPEVTSQQQFRADTPSAHIYTSTQTPVYARNTQQSPPQGPPQAMVQPAHQQRHVMDYNQQQQQQRPMTSQHQQQMSSQHQQATAQQLQTASQSPQPMTANQHQQPLTSQHQQLNKSQHTTMPQYLQSGAPHHQQQTPQQAQSAIPPQHQPAHLLQTSNQQAQQLQAMHHQQHAPRVATPQSHQVMPNAQPRQSPFQGRNVPPLSMQQQVQLPSQQGQTGPTVPFTAQQQGGMKTAAHRSSPSLPTAQTTQSRFVPQHMVPAQQATQTPAPPVYNHQTFQQPQEPGVGALAPPRLLRRTDQGVPHYASRHVTFALVPSLKIDEDDVEAASTIEELSDPAQSAGPPMSKMFPTHDDQPRVIASDLLREWTKMVDQNDESGQNALEERLQQHLGGALPKAYDNRLRQAVALKKKATGKRGPERSKVRPTKEADAAEWDALGIVYLSSPQPTNQEIGEGVAAFGKLIRGHVADLQKFKSRLKSAKEADSAALKEGIDHKLDCIYRVVAAANTWGDPQILANLGGNHKLVSDFVTCLIHANNSSDHNGKVPRSVLQLLSMVTTIDETFLMDSLQFAKISKKFDSKGDGEIKDFVQKIKQNAAARKVETAKEESKTERTSTPEPAASGYKGTAGLREAAKRAAATTSRASSITSATSSTVKRPREEEADTKPTKRVAAESGASSTGSKMATSKVVPGPTAAGPAPVKLIGNSLSMKKTTAKPVTKLPAKAEVKKDALKLNSASRIKKADTSKAEAPSASKLGGISALLDSISNAKSKPSGRSTPEKETKSEIEETPEEKKRRLRKEKRRHLRVSWKEGDELTEIRTFHKDAEEDEGRASNMIRDAHDDRSEGMMLKQGLMSATQDDEEEEEELPYRPWFQPTGVDFTAIPLQARSKNFVSRAGDVKFETEQQRFIAERDNKELMVVYTDPSDIPPTPKSPYTQPSEDADMEKTTVYELAQDDPKLAEIHLRWGEASSRGFSWARLNALRRAQKGQSATLSDVATMRESAVSANSNSASPSRPQSSEDRILAVLMSDHAKRYRDPEPVDPANPKTQRRYDYGDPEVQSAIDLCENVAEKLKGKPFPLTEPPEWMSNDKAKVAEWWHGYNKDKQRAEHKAQQQMMMDAAQAQPQVAPQGGQTEADANAAAWAAYYAQFQQQQQGQPQAAAAHTQDANAAAWAAYYAQQQAFAMSTQPAATAAAGDSNAQLNAVLAALTAPQQQVAAAQSSTDVQVQALLASLGGNPAAQQQSVPAYQAQSATQARAPDPTDPNYLNYIMSLAAGQPSSDQGPAYNNNNTGNDYYRDDNDMDGMHHSRRDDSVKRNRGSGGKGANLRGGGSIGGGEVPPHLRGINREKIGTKPCTFWAKGTCQKGDQCTFRHD